MSYATPEKAVQLYGSDYVTVSVDRDRDGVADTGVMQLFLDEATNEINGYLAGRIPLPLNPVPKNIERFCVDIAIYLARSTADLMTDMVKERYQNAIKYLTMVAKGQVLLVPNDTTGEEVTNEVVLPEAVGFEESDILGGEELVWTRSKMRGL